ncbi:DUF5677 domain-containing protein [Paenibacillus polymyxa]|uniref:DUF5677 domain-containing protein n=1 Tax=Paenibacillus polymyxa TaxID=1406 RepID=A0AAP3ZWC3_PAEPO|nr:DUF5677 domain-containing protein [Paenibacillus polymyxa]MDH2330473.1 DUF5677 domain-containing protein [Paenibacillus polymyxa]
MLKAEIEKLYKDHTMDDQRNLQLSKCISYGELVIQEIINQKKKITNSDLIVLVIYRKILELLDGLFLLADHQSYSSSVIVLRSLFETSTNFVYILIDPKKIEERTNYYYVGYALEEIKVCEALISNGKNNSTFSADKLQKTIDGHFINLNGKHNEIYKEWMQLKEKLATQRRNPDFYPHWYSVFRGPRSLKQLAEKANLKDIYEQIYSNFSLESHGFVSLTGLRKTKDDGVKFLPLRSDNPLKMQTYLGTRLFLMCTSYLIKIYLIHQLEDFEDFLEDINEHFILS